RQRSHRAPRLARLVRAGGPPAARASHLPRPQVRAPLLGPPASPPVVRAAGGGSRYEAARARGRLARDDALLAHAHLRPHRPRVGGTAGALLRAARVVAGGGDGRARGRLGQPAGRGGVCGWATWRRRSWDWNGLGMTMHTTQRVIRWGSWVA